MNMSGWMGHGRRHGVVFGAGNGCQQLHRCAERAAPTEPGNPSRSTASSTSGDSVFAPLLGRRENGFMPQNLPGFGSLHDNLAQNAQHYAGPA